MTIDDQMCRAPWTDEEITILNEYQTSGKMHPFTCRVQSSHGPGYLRATTDGWVCEEPECYYTQNWAHGFMIDGSWRDHRDVTYEIERREYYLAHKDNLDDWGEPE